MPTRTGKAVADSPMPNQRMAKDIYASDEKLLKKLTVESSAARPHAWRPNHSPCENLRTDR